MRSWRSDGRSRSGFRPRRSYRSRSLRRIDDRHEPSQLVVDVGDVRRTRRPSALIPNREPDNQQSQGERDRSERARTCEGIHRTAPDRPSPRIGLAFNRRRLPVRSGKSRPKVQSQPKVPCNETAGTRTHLGMPGIPTLHLIAHSADATTGCRGGCFGLGRPRRPWGSSRRSPAASTLRTLLIIFVSRLSSVPSSSPMARPCCSQAAA